MSQLENRLRKLEKGRPDLYPPRKVYCSLRVEIDGKITPDAIADDHERLNEAEGYDIQRIILVGVAPPQRGDSNAVH